MLSRESEQEPAGFQKLGADQKKTGYATLTSILLPVPVPVYYLSYKLSVLVNGTRIIPVPVPSFLPYIKWFQFITRTCPKNSLGLLAV